MAWENYLLVLARTGGLFLSAPVLNSRQIPVQVRVLFLMALSFAVAWMVPVKYAALLGNAGEFIMAFLAEALVGYAIGFLVNLVFAAIQLAGQLIDMEMGFGIVNVIDPMSGTQAPLLGNFQYLLALLVFLGIDGHHWLIRSLCESYRLVPVLGAKMDGPFVAFVMQQAGYMFLLAVKFAAPVVAALFIADVALGFVSRTVPQMNVFIVGLPLKIMGGLLMVMVIIPVFMWFTRLVLERFFGQIDVLLRLL